LSTYGVPPPRTCVCVRTLLALVVGLSAPATADPTIQIGREIDGQWVDASDVNQVSGPVRFCVRFPDTISPAPGAWFAVHTTDPIAAWKVTFAPMRHYLTTQEYVYMCPEYPSPSWPDGAWQIWCQVIYPEPPGGGGPDSIVPDDPYLESAEAAALLCSWTPPPYGWPEGFPCADEGQNDIYIGPASMSALNLTVEHIHATKHTGLGVVEELGELFAAAYGPGPAELIAEWQATLQDGHEIPDPAWTHVVASLVPLGTGPLRQGEGDGTPHNPPTVAGEFYNPNGVSPYGFYYRRADASEDATGDSASNIGEWALSDVHTVSYTYCAPRKAKIGVEGTLSTAADPSAEEYAWCRPLPLYQDSQRQSGFLATVEAAFSKNGSAVHVEYGGAQGLDLGEAGSHSLGMAFRDTRTYHMPGAHRWTPPQAVTFSTPAAACYAYDAVREACCATAYSYMGDLPAVGSMGQTFYSAVYEEHVRGGAVVSGTKANFLLALQHDQVIMNAGHGCPGLIWINNNPPAESLTGDEVMALPPESLSQARLVYAQSCHSFDRPTLLGYSYCEAVADRGAQAVVGYVEGIPIPGTSPAADFFYERLWYHWAINGMGIWSGIGLALAELHLNYGPHPGLDSIKLAPWHYDGSIAPAFTLP